MSPKPSLSSAIVLLALAPHAGIGADGLYASGFDDDWLSPGVHNLPLAVPEDTLRGRLYLPPPALRNGAAVVALHGCSGLWSNGQPDTVAQLAIEKWGQKLTADGFVVLAVDSYTDRTPSGGNPLDYQVQCNGSPLAGFVDPYTTRVADADFAVAWLGYRLGSLVDGRIGMIGWSQGAQAVLVRVAETGRFENASLYDAPDAPALPASVAIAFYPGCGPDLEFRDGPVATSYWRPHVPLRINHGGADPLEANCAIRAANATDVYGADWLAYVAYPGAGHGFDGSVGTWPAGGCQPEDSAGICAAKAADLASLQWLRSHLLAE